MKIKKIWMPKTRHNLEWLKWYNQFLNLSYLCDQINTKLNPLIYYRPVVTVKPCTFCLEIAVSCFRQKFEFLWLRCRIHERTVHLSRIFHSIGSERLLTEVTHESLWSSRAVKSREPFSESVWTEHSILLRLINTNINSLIHK